MLLCRHCMEELASRGEHYLTTDLPRYTMEDAEEMEVNCEWCEEVDDLYEVILDDYLNALL